MGRKLLHLLNGLITCAVVAALVIAGAYAGYALWDNQQVYDAAENSLSEMKEIRSALGMPATVSALTELLEENRAARKEKAEAAAAPAPEITSVPEITTVDAEPAQAATVTASTVSVEETAAPEIAASNAGGTTITVADDTAEDSETAAPETAAGNTGGTTITVSDGTAGDAETAAPAPVETTETATSAPTEEPVDDSLFGQLKAINPDITAWITLPGTAIDYPVMQGSTNYSYINTDVYGNFALAGSIFLDSRNSEDYTDTYNLLYGHNMSEHRMFSDVNLYKEEEFFKENTLGMLLLPDGNHIFEILAVIVTSASDSGLMNPENWTYLDGEGIYRMAQEKAMFTCEKGLEALREQIEDEEATPHLLALSTCSDEFTDARTILLTLMDP